MTAPILNLFDTACTIYAVNRGGVELNPFMRCLLQYPVAFIGYKHLVVGGLLWWLSQREERLAVIGLRVCTAVYAALCIYHIFGLIGGI